ncbi:larval cuticle protein A2B [Drosophila miranda]|uniref:larval cuticle protein A2B n=1 Tax=Drosophila miranda TaxID=7229 RepID=UPI00143F54B2|nr:larval cuticle protein A2B [Drosophila miranda]
MVEDSESKKINSYLPSDKINQFQFAFFELRTFCRGIKSSARWPVNHSTASLSSEQLTDTIKPTSKPPKFRAMAFKFFAVLALVAAVSAGVVPVQQVYHAPAPAVAYAHAPVAVAHAQPVLAKHDDEYDPHPQYKFAYDVQDALSGDSKSQVEERDGDVVHGEYSLNDSDGYRRIVQYTSDPINGFNAVVNRVPLDHVKTVVKSVAPVAVAAAPLPVAYHQHH